MYDPAEIASKFSVKGVATAPQGVANETGPSVSEYVVELQAVTAYTSYVEDPTKELSVAVPELTVVVEPPELGLKPAKP